MLAANRVVDHSLRGSVDNYRLLNRVGDPDLLIPLLAPHSARSAKAQQRRPAGNRVLKKSNLSFKNLVDVRDELARVPLPRRKGPAEAGL